MYRDLWRVHVLAAISLVACTGLCFDAFRDERLWAALGWFVGALAAAGVLSTPMILKRAAERQNPQPGRHNSGRPTGSAVSVNLPDTGMPTNTTAETTGDDPNQRDASAPPLAEMLWWSQESRYDRS